MKYNSNRLITTNNYSFILLFRYMVSFHCWTLHDWLLFCFVLDQTCKYQSSSVHGAADFNTHTPQCPDAKKQSVNELCLPPNWLILNAVKYQQKYYHVLVPTLCLLLHILLTCVKLQSYGQWTWFLQDVPLDIYHLYYHNVAIRLVSTLDQMLASSLYGMLYSRFLLKCYSEHTGLCHSMYVRYLAGF